MIIYCGGNLPRSTGDVVASKIKLVNQFGASELGLMALLQLKRDCDQEDWKYVQFHPDTGYELRPVATLAAASPLLLFISSISSVLLYHSASLQTPEEVILAVSAPGPNGYAESKYISERLLNHAAQRLSVNASFACVGQIACAVKHAGLWNKAESFPSLAISSLHVGAVQTH